MYRIKTRHSK